MELSKLVRCLSSPVIHDVQGRLASLNIRALISDSRKVTPNSLFVAVTGHRADSHDTLPQSVQAGLKACIVQRKVNLPDEVVQIQVKDSRKALSLLACEFYGHPSREMCLVAITGTNGKTTSSYILEAVLKAAGFSPGVIGTVNYRYAGKEYDAPLTTPDPIQFQHTLRQMKDSGVTHVIFEASSHALKQGRIDGTHIDGALFTNLTQDHLDFHDTMDDYFESKKKLFSTVLSNSEKKEPFSVVNIDDPHGKKLFEELKRRGATISPYSVSSEEAKIRSTSFEFDLDGLRAKITTPFGELSIHSPLLGQFNLLNILGAIATGCNLHLSLEVIKKGVESVQVVPGRLEKVEAGQKFSVLVDYAHTDDALRNVGAALSELKTKRIITVFGCGGDRDQLKRPLMAKVAASFSDVVIVTSDNPRTEDPQEIIDDIVEGLKSLSIPVYSEEKQRGYMIQSDRKKAIKSAIQMAHSSDIVLIAGKGHEDYQILGAKKIHFDDREVAKEVLCSK